MGQYVNGSLLPNEQIEAEAKPHWAMFIAPTLLLVLLFLVLPKDTTTNNILALVFIWLATRVMVYRTTELALTNKRVIAKSGIFSRNVVDVSLTKVEGISYTQGIVGRIFGYGSILVRGTGVGRVPIKFISQPEHFKHEVGRILHA